MVVGQASPGELEALRRSHCMCVVVAQDADALLVVQRQAVPDAMLSMFRRWDPPCLNLHPVAAFLLQDAAVQIKKCFEADVGSVHQHHTISPDDT